MTAILLSMSLVTVVFTSILALLAKQFMAFLTEWPELKIKLLESVDSISLYLLRTFTISKELQNEWLVQTMHQSGGFIFGFIQQILTASTFSLVLLIMIPIFSTLILYQRNRLVRVVYSLFPIERRSDIQTILGSVITAYYRFMKGMVLVYFVVGTLNSIGLLLLGIPHAFLFGYVAAILTFIPYVGIMVGSLLPITLAWITFTSIWYPVGVVFLFAFVQYLEAYLIFPLAVSNRLKINALATLCVIIIGGILWGVAGMILFIPFLAFAKLVADSHPRFKAWSLLLGTSKSEHNLN